MKRKKLLIIASIFIVCLIVVLGLGLKNKVSPNVAKDDDKNKFFQVEEAGGSKFKGISTISKEQKVMIDKSQGEVRDLSVKDKQYVEKGTVLFTYYNTEADEQVSELNRQINSINSKVEKQKEQTNSLPKEQQGAISQGNMGEDVKENINELIAKRDALKKKVTKAVTAEFDGVVYIDNNGKNDPTKEYIKVVSKEPLVVSEASEFDVESLKVDEPVQIKVISNGEKINGKITKIDDLPSTGEDKKSVAYKFDVKPEKDIRVGFSVEVTVNPQKIKIPKKYVVLENDKTFVNILNGENSSKKVEIKATLDGDNYILEDESIKPGDKLLENPSEEAGGEK